MSYVRRTKSRPRGQLAQERATSRAQQAAARRIAMQQQLAIRQALQRQTAAMDTADRAKTLRNVTLRQQQNSLRARTQEMIQQRQDQALALVESAKQQLRDLLATPDGKKALEAQGISIAEASKPSELDALRSQQQLLALRDQAAAAMAQKTRAAQDTLLAEAAVASRDALERATATTDAMKERFEVYKEYSLQVDAIPRFQTERNNAQAERSAVTAELNAVQPKRQELQGYVTDALVLVNAKTSQLTQASFNAYLDVATLQQSIETLSQQITQTQTDLTNATTSLATYESEIATIRTELDGLETQTTNLQDAHTKLLADLATNQANLELYRTLRPGEIDATTQNLLNQQRNINAAIAKIEADMADTSGRIATLKSQMDTANANRLAAESERARAEQEAADLAQRRLADAEAAFAASSTRLQTAIDTKTSLDEQISGLESQLRPLIDQVNTLEPTRNNLQTDLETNLQPSLQTLQESYNSAVSIMEGLKGARATLEQAISDLRGIVASIQDSLGLTGVPTKSTLQLEAETGMKNALDTIDGLNTAVQNAAIEVQGAEVLVETATNNLGPTTPAMQLYQNALAEYETSVGKLNYAQTVYNTLFSTIRDKLAQLQTLMKVRAKALFDLQASTATLDKSVFEFQQQTYSSLRDGTMSLLSSMSNLLNTATQSARTAFQNATSLRVQLDLNTSVLDKLQATFLANATTLSSGLSELAAMRAGLQDAVSTLQTTTIPQLQSKLRTLSADVAILQGNAKTSKKELDAALEAKAALQESLAAHVFVRAQIQQLLADADARFGLQSSRPAKAMQGSASLGHSNTTQYFANLAESATIVRAAELASSAADAKAAAAASYATLQSVAVAQTQTEATKAGVETQLATTQGELNAAAKQLIQIQTDSTLLNSDVVDSATIQSLADVNQKLKTATAELSTNLADAAMIQDGIIDSNNNIQESTGTLSGLASTLNSLLSTRDAKQAALDPAMAQLSGLQTQMDTNVSNMNTNITLVGQLRSMLSSFLSANAQFQSALQQKKDAADAQGIFQGLQTEAGLQVLRADGLADTFRAAAQSNLQSVVDMQSSLDQILPYISEGKLVLESADFAGIQDALKSLAANLADATDTRAAILKQLTITKNDSATRSELNSTNIARLQALETLRDGILAYTNMQFQRALDAALLSGTKDALAKIQESLSDANIKSKLDLVGLQQEYGKLKNESTGILNSIQSQTAAKEALEKQIAALQAQKFDLETKISQQTDLKIQIKQQMLLENTGKLGEVLKRLYDAQDAKIKNTKEIQDLLNEIDNLKDKTDTDRLKALADRLKQLLETRDSLNQQIRAALNEQLNLQNENGRLQNEVKIMQDTKNSLLNQLKSGNKNTFLLGALAFAALGVVGATAGVFGSTPGGISLPGGPKIPGVSDLNEYAQGYRDGNAKALIDGGAAGYQRGFRDAAFEWAMVRKGSLGLGDLVSQSEPGQEDASGADISGAAADISGAVTDLSGAAADPQAGGQVQITNEELREPSLPSVEDAPPLPETDSTATATMPEPEPAPPEPEPDAAPPEAADNSQTPQNAIERFKPWLEKEATVTIPSEIPTPSASEYTIPYPAGRSQSYLRGFRDGYLAGYPRGFRAQYLAGWNMYNPGRDLLGLAKKALPEVKRIGEAGSEEGAEEGPEPPAPEDQERPVKPEEEVVPTLDAQTPDPIVTDAVPDLYDDDALLIKARQPPGTTEGL